MRQMLLVACLLSLPVIAGESVQPTIGTPVTLKIPMDVFESSIQRALRVFETSGREFPLQYEARITKRDGKLQVNGDGDWQAAGFPSMLELEVQKIKKFKRKKIIRVELGNQEQSFILEFAGATESELPDWFDEIVCTGTSTQIPARKYLKEAYSILAERLFTDDLSMIPNPEKLLLIQFAHEIGSMSMRTEVLDDSKYFVVHLGFDANIFNSLKVNATERAARVINTSLLIVLKAFSMAIEDSSAIDGLKIERMIMHKPFTGEYPDSMYDMDKLELYVPKNPIMDFSEQEIDSQDLIDQSIVILNSDRILVPHSR